MSQARRYPSDLTDEQWQLIRSLLSKEKGNRRRPRCSACYRLKRPLAGWDLHPRKSDTLSRHAMYHFPFCY
jgi:transposase